MDYYSFQPVKMHRTIAINLNKTQMGRIVVLCDNNSHKIRSKFKLWSVTGWLNALVTELYLTAHVNSLAEVLLPKILDTDTQTDKLNKTLIYEWATPRIELEVLLGDSRGNWASLGETAIKNSNGYRYRRHRLLDLLTDNPGFQLEENYRLGVLLKNMGFGDIKDTDKLSITGNWTQEFVAIQQQPPYVVNNLYGGSNTPTPVATSQAVLSLALASGSSAFILSSSQINISLTKAQANKTYTAIWRKDSTNTVLTSTLTTDSNGVANLVYDSFNFASSGTGKYSLELIDNGKTITSNEINAVLPTLLVAPSPIYNWSSATATVAVSGLALNTTYTLEFVGVTGTSATKTQTAEITPFNFSGNIFTTPGTYKARLTKNGVSVESNNLVVNAAPTLSLTTARNGLGFFAEDTVMSFRGTNLQPSTALTFSWLKADVAVISGSSSSDSSGNWEGSFGCSTFLNSPFGEGIYKLKIVQGSIELTSGQIELRALKFTTQPAQNQSYAQQQSITFFFSGIPVGATFTYTILKGGIVQGSPVNQTFSYSSSAAIYGSLYLNSTTISNAYGIGNNYSVRITYSGKTLDSNTFNITSQTYSDTGGLG